MNPQSDMPVMEVVKQLKENYKATTNDANFIVTVDKMSRMSARQSSPQACANCPGASGRRRTSTVPLHGQRCQLELSFQRLCTTLRHVASQKDVDSHSTHLDHDHVHYCDRARRDADDDLHETINNFSTLDS